MMASSCDELFRPSWEMVAALPASESKSCSTAPQFEVSPSLSVARFEFWREQPFRPQLPWLLLLTIA